MSMFVCVLKFADDPALPLTKSLVTYIHILAIPGAQGEEESGEILGCTIAKNSAIPPFAVSIVMETVASIPSIRAFPEAY